VTIDLAVSGVAGDAARESQDVKDPDPDAKDMLGNAKVATPDSSQSELRRGPSKTGDAHPGTAPSGDLSLGRSQASGNQPTEADIDRALAIRSISAMAIARMKDSLPLPLRGSAESGSWGLPKTTLMQAILRQ
jgi:hypothetical protein